MASTSNAQGDSHELSESPPPYQPDFSTALPNRPRSENSEVSVPNSTPPSSSNSPADEADPGNLVFVEAVIRDSNSKPVNANIFLHPDTRNLHTYDEYINGRHGWKTGDLHVACIDSKVGYRALLNQLLESVVRQEPSYITVKKWRQEKVGVRVVTVLWEGEESSYSTERCKTRVSLNTDRQVGIVLGKMKERGWRDRLEVGFILDK